MANYKQVGYGSQGNDVKTLQEMLNSNGYQLDVDGIFGNKTLSAVKDYQKKNNLAVDGIVGTNTWGTLTRAGTSGTTATTSQPAAPAATTGGSQNTASQGGDAVTQAQAMIQQQLVQTPGAYQSQWQAQLDEMMQKILNREKFSYDLNGDALYQQYKDQYVQQGQMAMMDTMGQAQAMTGGYGNSYAQSVGQQAYQGHLQNLNDVVPELYQMALSKYQNEGQAMLDQYGMLASLEQQGYDRHQDDIAYQQYLESMQYQKDRDKIADEQWQAQFDEAKRQYDHANGINSSSGGSGSSGSSSGSGGGGSSGGGGGSGSSKSYDTHGYTKAEIIAMQKAAGITADGIWGPQTQKAYEAGYRPDDAPAGGGGGFTGSTYSEAAAYLKANGKSAAGLMTSSEWARHKNKNNSAGGEHEASSYKEYLAAYVYGAMN